MVLIISRKDDVHADLVINELRKRGGEYFRLNTDCAHQYRIGLSLKGLEIVNPRNGKIVTDRRIKSIWLRRRSYPDIQDLSPSFREFTHSEWLHFYRSIWFALQDKFWVNSPEHSDRAAIKWRQLSAAANCGFLIPPTLYTNSASAVIASDYLGDDCIYKAHDVGGLAGSSDYAIHTSSFRRASLSPQTEDLPLCPGIFQPLIAKGFELRVNVIGHKLLCTKIDSQASERSRIDWRKADPAEISHTPFELGRADKSKCLNLVKQLGLKFAALDLIVTPENQLVFLELNANGQWAWIEALTSQPIARTLSELLLRRTKVASKHVDTI